MEDKKEIIQKEIERGKKVQKKLKDMIAGMTEEQKKHEMCSKSSRCDFCEQIRIVLEKDQELGGIFIKKMDIK